MAKAKTKPAAAPAPQVAPAADPVDLTNVAAVELALHLIDENADNPRQDVDEAEDAELTQSIGARGVLQPIMVRPSAEAGRYVVVAGSRRRRCSLAAGKLTIPAVIRTDLDDEQAFELATIENVARNNMSAMDDARAYRRMIDARMAKDPNLTLKAAKEAVAAVVGKSVRIIELRLEFLEKLPAVKQLELQQGKITAREATDWIRKQPKPLNLTAAEWLLALEVYDKVKADPLPMTESWLKDRFTECGADARFDEDGRIKRLTDYPNQLLTLVSHVMDDGGETGRFYIGVGYEAKRHLELKFGDLTTPSQRLHAMDPLRKELGLPRLAPGYSTPWLNGPFECPDSLKPEIEAARKKRAQERAEQAEVEAARQREAEEKRAAVEAEKEAEAAFLADVMALQADLEARPEGVDWTEDFRARFRDLWAKRGVAGPFTVGHRDDDPRNPTQIVDGAGEPNMDADAGLEARRRLMALALNFAGGWDMTSGPLFRTPWSPDAPEPKRPVEVLPRERFAQMVADYLADDVEDLPDDPAEAQFELLERTSRGLDAFLAQEGIEYGDEGYDWSDDGAMQLAELIRVEGLGQPSDGTCQACGACPGFVGAECDGDCDHAKAQDDADDVELSPALQRLAGVTGEAQAEAQP